MYYALDIIGITDKGQGFIIKEALDLTFSELLPQSQDIYDITVYVSDEVGDAHGCVCDEEDNEFSIVLNKSILDNDIELFKTVCHEAVHISQYIKTDLIHLPGNKFAWKGSIIEEMDYEKRPWEIEAFEYEEKAACRFAQNQ